MSKRDILINLITRSDKKGLDDAAKGLENLGSKAEKSGGKFGALSGLLNKFGDNVGKELTGKLGPAGEAADKLGVGLDDLKGTTAAAGAGIAAFAAFVAGGVKKTQELYDATRDFNEVAGTSWEQGSRLIAVMDDLRVSSDEGATAMRYLSKTVGETPQKLAEFGIQVARAKDGTVDMAGTLENAATAFKNTADPAKRAALGNALFGRSWQNMVPILNQGGDALKELVDGVDKSQVATAKGAEQQDKLFEATDNLHDAIDGLQRALAQDVIPQLIEFAHWSTQAVNAISKINDVVPLVDAFTRALPGPGQISKGKDALEALGVSVGKVGDKVQIASEETKKLTNDATLPLIPAQAKLQQALENSAESAATMKVRAKEAGDEFKEWEQKTRDLKKAQEDLQQAQLGLVDTELALEQAQIRAGDASLELSDKAHVAEVAVREHGAASTEAQAATEAHRRALLDAEQAMDASGDAAVANAVKQAEANGTTLDAAHQTLAYHDELVRLRAAAQDPTLIAWLDAQIGRYAAVAEQARNAAAAAAAFRREQADQAGIERDYSSGGVTRRATGGPVWPGQTYLVGEHGPEVLRLPAGTGPGYVQSNPEAARFSKQMGGASPIGSPASGLAFPSLRTTPAGTPAGSALTGGGTVGGYLPGFAPQAASSPAGGGGTTVIINNYGGFLDVKKLVDTIRAYEKANK